MNGYCIKQGKELLLFETDRETLVSVLTIRGYVPYTNKTLTQFSDNHSDFWGQDGNLIEIKSCILTQPEIIMKEHNLPKKCEHEYGAIAVDGYTESISKEMVESGDYTDEGEYAHAGAVWFNFCPECGKKLFTDEGEYTDE